MPHSVREDYKFYNTLLRSPEKLEFPDELQPGLYLLDDEPVAVWRDPADQRIRLRVGETTYSDVDDEFASFASTEWTQCKAVTKVDYDKQIAAVALAPKDHNKPPDENSLAAISERVAELAREADRMLRAGAAKDKASADMAADLANLLTTISQKADEVRKDEQRDWRERINLSNVAWYPPRDTAAELSVALKKQVIDPYLDRIEKETRAEAERQAKLGVPTHPEEVTKKITAGTRGRQVSRRTVTNVRIIDYAAALNHYKDHPDIKAAVLKLAMRTAKIGVTVPGVEVIKEKTSV